MARKISNYSTFLNQLCNLVGVPSTRVPTELFNGWNASFNTSMQKMWSGNAWVEISPYGEARFVGNRLSYPNNLANTTYWTATAVTVTANSINNPADGNLTASKVMETAANSAHKVVQTIPSLFPSTNYSFTFYARPNGRSYQYISIFDGTTTFSAFFNTTTGAIGTVSNFTSVTMGQQPNGFWLCTATFTTSSTATATGTYSLQLSSDGSTLSYAGDTSKGAYFWGCLVQQTQNTPVQDLLLPWTQLGENDIDVIYNVWATSPFSANFPPQFGFNVLPNGIQIINGTPYQYNYYLNGVAQTNLYGAPPNNPIFIYYRKTVPSWAGDAYSASATYSVDDQIYFTSSDGTSDYWKCIVATTAGQSPDTTPNSWELIPVYQTFVNYATYMTYADWLTSDGESEKAALYYAMAEDRMAVMLDVWERQMPAMAPMVVTNHLTSRSSW